MQYSSRQAAAPIALMSDLLGIDMHPPSMRSTCGSDQTALASCLQQCASAPPCASAAGARAAHEHVCRPRCAVRNLLQRCQQRLQSTTPRLPAPCMCSTNKLRLLAATGDVHKVQWHRLQLTLQHSGTPTLTCCGRIDTSRLGSSHPVGLQGRQELRRATALSSTLAYKCRCARSVHQEGRLPHFRVLTLCSVAHTLRALSQPNCIKKL